ncbi:hypothetical protein AKN93_02535 [Thiopseudomonas alkaliphila]|nr:hypothetical protein AKN93_02535 [Thiopseudomonas alkaliphila]AKX53532.1 hypothetical protein AKN91_07490 [Thiopseudomonas alkaliphila]
MTTFHVSSFNSFHYDTQFLAENSAVKKNALNTHFAQFFRDILLKKGGIDGGDFCNRNCLAKGLIIQVKQTKA